MGMKIVLNDGAEVDLQLAIYQNAYPWYESLSESIGRMTLSFPKKRRKGACQFSYPLEALGLLELLLNDLGSWYNSHEQADIRFHPDERYVPTHLDLYQDIQDDGQRGMVDDELICVGKARFSASSGNRLGEEYWIERPVTARLTFSSHLARFATLRRGGERTLEEKSTGKK